MCVTTEAAMHTRQRVKVSQRRTLNGITGACYMEVTRGPRVTLILTPGTPGCLGLSFHAESSSSRPKAGLGGIAARWPWVGAIRALFAMTILTKTELGHAHTGPSKLETLYTRKAGLSLKILTKKLGPALRSVFYFSKH